MGEAENRRPGNDDLDLSGVHVSPAVADTAPPGYGLAALLAVGIVVVFSTLAWAFRRVRSRRNNAERSPDDSV